MDARIGGDRVEATRTLTRLAEAMAARGVGRRAPRLLYVQPEGARRRPPDTNAAERDAARSAVCSFVVQLREHGVPPERMLVDVKGVAREASVGVLDPTSTRALVDDVVRWSVEAFYAS